MSAGEPTWVRAFAPAKLNPWLAVLGRRPDGYHELETVLVALDLGDRLAARRSASGRVELELTGPAAGADVPRDGRNLALAGARIALRLARAAGTCGPGAGLELRLVKELPSQAGLGGASSDAAAALLAGAGALGLDLEPGSTTHGAALDALAALGSDCPFFLGAPGGAARCTGRGERVAPLAAPRPPWQVALVVPAVGAPTAAVYGALGPADFGGRPLPAFSGDALPPASALPAAPFFNQLEPAALRAVPALGPWRALLDGLFPGAFHLSGSGSSFFAVQGDRADALRLLEAVLAQAARRGLAVRGAWVAATRDRGASLDSAERV